MLERHNKITAYLFYFLIVIELMIIIFLSFKQHMNVSFKNEPYYSINNDWSYEDKIGFRHFVDLPAKLDTGSDNTIIISRKLSSKIHNVNAVSILSDHQDIYVYLEDELIYAKANSSNSSILNVPSASMWVLVPLPPNSSGKTITFKIDSQYDDYAGKVNEIYAGTKSSLLIHLINSSYLNLIIAVIILISGIIAIFTYYFLKRLLTLNRSILFLGWFSILASIWMIMESNLMQIFMDNEFVISSLTYLSLMTFPIPILLYVTLLDHYHYKKTAYYLTYIFTGSAFIQILLQFFNLLDFHQCLIVVKSEIILLFGVIIITLLLELIRYKNWELKVFTISAGILFAFGMIELFTYKFRVGVNRGNFFQLGFLFFTVILIWDSLKKFAKAIKLSETARHYKILATRDLLTNCRSRVAYARDLEQLSLDRNITIFLADMNNMKMINDTYGHHSGDEAIILCSQCLLKVFKQRVYRIGGDEFVSIQFNLDQNKIASMLKDFQIECETANKDIPYNFYMSIGYAVFDKTIDKTIYDTVERADKNMYENKIKMKE